MAKKDNFPDFRYQSQPGKTKRAFNLNRFLSNNSKKRRTYKNSSTTLSGGPAPEKKPVPENGRANTVRVHEERVDAREYAEKGFIHPEHALLMYKNSEQYQDWYGSPYKEEDGTVDKTAKHYVSVRMIGGHSFKLTHASGPNKGKSWILKIGHPKLEEQTISEAEGNFPPARLIGAGMKAAKKKHGVDPNMPYKELKSKHPEVAKTGWRIAHVFWRKEKAEARKNKKVKKESIEEGRALTFQQRLARSRHMRRIEPKVYRGQIRYQDRVPSQARLEKRAERMARNIIKMRISHTPYDEMSVPEKIMIDKILEKKQKAIKKLAQRLLPKVRKISMQRISGTQIPIQKILYQSTDLYDDTLSLIESKLSNVEDNNLKESLQTIIALSTNEETPAVQSLRKKADIAGVSFEEIVSVYAEAVSEYTSQKITSEQYAFNAVNSFVSNKVNQLAENMFIGPPTDPTNLAVELVKTTGVKNAVPVAAKVAVDSVKKNLKSLAALRNKTKKENK